tara:strand:- start:1481 stop:2026 length:546 start_codon:yes stop_codon:yes gene_type:complete
MKTPQVEHGVLDPKTGEEITTPLGLRRIVPILREGNNPFEMDELSKEEQAEKFNETLESCIGSDLPPVSHQIPGWKYKLLLSEGTTYFREFAYGGAYWLMDVLLTEVVPLYEQQKELSMLVIKVKSKNQEAGITATAEDEKNEEYTVWHREIDFTFLDGDYKFWLFPVAPNTAHLILPNEY